MINTVVFLTGWPLSTDFIKKFDFQELESLGYKPIVLDLSPLIRPEALDKITTFEIYESGQKITTYQEFDEFLKEHAAHAIFIDFVLAHHDIDLTTEKMYRHLKRHRSRIFVVEYGALPNWDVLPTGQGAYKLKVFLLRLKRLLQPKVVFNTIVRKAIIFLRKHNILYPKPVRVFRTSLLGYEGFFTKLDLSQTIFRECHSLDYNFYLKTKRTGTFQKYVEGPYCVFFWTNIGNAADHAITGLPYVQMDNYHARLTEFFDQIEKELGLEVVLSVHPRNGYDGMPNPFNKKVFRGKSLDLVARSQLVITHGSTAVNFPVLLEKPIVFVVTDDILYIPDMVLTTPAMAKTLDSVYANLNHDKVDLKHVMRPYSQLKTHYENYKRLYTASEKNKDLTNWEIITKEIKALD